MPGRLCALLVPLAFQTFRPISVSEMLSSCPEEVDASRHASYGPDQVKVLFCCEFMALLSILDIISLAVKGKPDALSIFLCCFFTGMFTKRSIPIPEQTKERGVPISQT